MVFSSPLFIFLYLAITLALYYLAPNRVYRNVVLCLLSLIFYGWGEPVFVLLMIFSILMNYTAGMLVGKWHDDKKKSRTVLIVAVSINLLLLAIPYNMLTVLALELLVLAAEYAAYALAFGRSGRLFLYTMLANLISFFLGGAILRLIP